MSMGDREMFCEGAWGCPIHSATYEGFWVLSAAPNARPSSWSVSRTARLIGTLIIPISQTTTARAQRGQSRDLAQVARPVRFILMMSDLGPGLISCF